jgi:putative tricarboxylic transport membrane protein
MDLFNQLLIGFSIALQPTNLFYCFVGCFMGTLTGVLPGIGATGAVALFIPATFSMPPVTAIIMLSGIYYGAMYGGSTTSILVNIPGEASSVTTCLDGYEMARQGRAGPALGMAAMGSFIAGTFGVIILTLVAPPLAEAALRIGPPEFVALMILGMVTLTFLSSTSMVKALIMACLGILLGIVGVDSASGQFRFTFGRVELFDGIGIAPVVMGLFGISEVLQNLEQKVHRDIYKADVKGLFPTLQDWMQCKWAIVRGTLIGFFFGTLPGGGAIISSFIAYAMEKRFSRYPEKFGTGVIEGVAAPESANNAASQGAFIPLLSLGIPSNALMALLLGALMIHGVTPGPLLLSQHPEVFWGVIASMYLGNIMLLVLNLPLIGLWVKVLKVPYVFLMPLIVLFCVVGAFSINNTVTDVFVMFIFGVIGYVLKKFHYDSAPLILAFVLGPLLEYSLTQSLIMSNGSFQIFITRPLSAICLILAMLLLFLPGLLQSSRKRLKVIQKSDSIS